MDKIEIPKGANTQWIIIAFGSHLCIDHPELGSLQSVFPIRLVRLDLYQHSVMQMEMFCNPDKTIALQKVSRITTSR
jgi:hypothetical protein